MPTREAEWSFMILSEERERITHAPATPARNHRLPKTRISRIPRDIFVLKYGAVYYEAGVISLFFAERISYATTGAARAFSRALHVCMCIAINPTPDIIQFAPVKKICNVWKKKKKKKRNGELMISAVSSRAFVTRVRNKLPRGAL